jgi:hypothetical protein
MAQTQSTAAPLGLAPDIRPALEAAGAWVADREAAYLQRLRDTVVLVRNVARHLPLVNTLWAALGASGLAQRLAQGRWRVEHAGRLLPMLLDPAVQTAFNMLSSTKIKCMQFTTWPCCLLHAGKGRENIHHLFNLMHECTQSAIDATQGTGAAQGPHAGLPDVLSPALPDGLSALEMFVRHAEGQSQADLVEDAPQVCQDLRVLRPCLGLCRCGSGPVDHHCLCVLHVM